MKIAVVYYSMSENTAFAADRIAARLGADCIRLTPVKSIPDKGFRKFLWGGKSALMGETPELEPYTFDAEKYDVLIFGTPVWASSPAPPLRSFIKAQGQALAGKRFYAFACLMGSGILFLHFLRLQGESGRQHQGQQEKYFFHTYLIFSSLIASYGSITR